MSQPLGLLLPDIEDVGQVGGPADLLQLPLLAGPLQALLQLGVVVEVVVHSGLGPVGHHQDILDAGVYRLLDDILDHRLVHQGEHLLGNRLGGGQHPGPQPGCGNDGFPDLHWFSCLLTTE